MRWKLGRRVGAARCRVRVSTGDEERVRRGLRPVADRVRGGITHPPGHLPAHETGEPRKHRDGDHEPARPERGEGREHGRPGERERQHEGGDREHETHRGPEPPLLRRRVDLDIDRIAPVTAEARVGIGCEGEVREEMRGVARVVREEPVQRLRHAAEHQHEQPGDERDHDRGRRVDGQPHEVGDGEHEPEEHGQPSAIELVAHDEPDRMTAPHRVGRHAHARILRRDAAVLHIEPLGSPT